MTVRLTSWFVGWLFESSISPSADCYLGQLVSRLFGLTVRLLDKWNCMYLVLWLDGRLVGWLVDWSVGWLANCLLACLVGTLVALCVSGLFRLSVKLVGIWN